MTKLCRDNQIKRMDTITEAIQNMLDWQKYNSKGKTIELLTQMQEIIITVGTVLEQDLQDFNSLVIEIEQLTEIIYQISISLDNTAKNILLIDDAQNKIEYLQKALYTISPKKEVVFLPYQVSMWDSLESVWLEAREDLEVESFVVPIPFYDVLPDNSLGELHDQKLDYPDYVPVTAYENYLLEERYPDIIFFHNPYDECNLVTRVPERYYASQLKKYTKQLVYIPYFISPVDGPSDRQCCLPGVLFADKVVVQPQKTYETYCKVYAQMLKENKWEKILVSPEKKFLPLGSPKLDKLTNINCEIGDLPKSWQKVILKPDGSRKKIILYNLTINGLLSSNEQVINKMDCVFQLFKERKDDVVLLWRPHPLLLTTIYSMRPYLRDAYLKRVSWFRKEGWGIFDETPHSSLALALSDAYYGDWSSLIVAFEMTGKLMQIQNVWESEEKDFLEKVLKSNYEHLKNENIKNKQGMQKNVGASVYRFIMSNLK